MIHFPRYWTQPNTSYSITLVTRYPRFISLRHAGHEPREYTDLKEGVGVIENW